jgi:hypothetical protein
MTQEEEIQRKTLLQIQAKALLAVAENPQNRQAEPNQRPVITIFFDGGNLMPDEMRFTCQTAEEEKVLAEFCGVIAKLLRAGIERAEESGK